MASITLNGIRKRFSDNEVLRTLDLEIRDGEFLTLVGPSGCGKSTLLRIIAGLEAQSAGDVLIGGRIVNDVRPSRRDLVAEADRIRAMTPEPLPDSTKLLREDRDRR